MLRHRGRTRCAGEQERQVGEIAPATIGPPFRCESQQNFDDITESDIGTGRGLLAYGLRKRDFGQAGETRTRKRRPWSAGPRFKVTSATRGRASGALTSSAAAGTFATTAACRLAPIVDELIIELE